MRWVRGFTLIELLIVIVIISVIAGIAVMTLSSNQKNALEVQAKQFKNSLLLAEQEAMLHPETIGLAITPTDYKWFSYQDTAKHDESPWKTLTQPLTPHPWLHHADVSLSMHDEMIALSNHPQIIVSPSGDVTPFVIYLKMKTTRIKITGLANGDVSYEVIDE